jgi:peptidoglycan/xylan/chitin deacetylase (PgdA/CDA1 family)
LRTAITFDDLAPGHVPPLELQHLLTFLEHEEIPATLFAIPEDSSDQSLKERYIQLLKRADADGHEIALHGYRHATNEFGYMIPIPFPRLEQQMELLRLGKCYLTESLGTAPMGFRAPDYRHSWITLEALARLDFKYDSSRTLFKPTQGGPIRFKTGVPPRVHKAGRILEIPVTGEYTHDLRGISRESVAARARNDFNWVREHEGVFVVNSHIDRAALSRCNLLSALIDELRSETEFVRLKDLTH